MFYQNKISVNTRSHCKYSPTCSEYAKQCYENYNILYASILSFYRIIRCNPLSKGGYDPIPKYKKILKAEIKKEESLDSSNEDSI